MKQLIENLLRDHNSAHSLYQIENFIVGAEVHPYFRYKQALREIAARVDAFYQRRFEIEDLREAIEKLKRRKLFLSRKSKVKHARELSRQSRRFYIMRLSRRDQVKEFAAFLKEALRLKKEIGILTPGRIRELEKGAWEAKALEMIKIDLLCSGAISQRTMEFIAQLDRQSLEKLIPEVQQIRLKSFAGF